MARRRPPRPPRSSIGQVPRPSRGISRPSFSTIVGAGVTVAPIPSDPAGRPAGVAPRPGPPPTPARGRRPAAPPPRPRRRSARSTTRSASSNSTSRRRAARRDPTRRRHQRRELEQPSRAVEVAAEPSRALHRLRDVGDGPVAPPADLIPEEPEPPRDARPDSPSATTPRTAPSPRRTGVISITKRPSAAPRAPSGTDRAARARQPGGHWPRRPARSSGRDGRRRRAAAVEMDAHGGRADQWRIPGSNR